MQSETTPIAISRKIATVALFIALGLVGVQTLFAVPALSWRLAAVESVATPWMIGILVAAGSLLAAFLMRRNLSAKARRVLSSVERFSLLNWLLIVVGIGVLLRVGWVLAYPAEPASDGFTYLTLAQALSDGEPYEIAGTRAYWPPGFAFLLTPVVSVFGAGPFGIAVLNLTLFVGLALGVYGLGRVVASDGVGRLGALAVAVWPTLVAMSGLPEKEQPVALIVVLVFLALYSRTAFDGWRTIAAGLLLGFGCLIQPSLLLLPSAILVGDLLAGVRFRYTAARLAVVLLGMMLVISPWTLRNYSVFGEFVLISTNGGSNLYRANNPLATGGYMPAGAVDLRGLPELEASAKGAALAKQWISENPKQFLALSFEKQIRFLGDDSTGVYASLRRGGLEIGNITYALWKNIANLFWFTLWVIICFAAWRWAARAPASGKLAAPVALGFLYLYALHSVFESNGKYHLPALGLLAVLAALAVVTLAADTQAKQPATK